MVLFVYLMYVLLIYIVNHLLLLAQKYLCYNTQLKSNKWNQVFFHYNKVEITIRLAHCGH